MGWPRMARRAAELGALELQIATANLESILHVASRTFAVAADQSISDWAERNRILPKGTTPRPGPFRAEAFQRGILDSVRMRRTKKVVCLKSTQIGWTDAILLNMIAYFIAVDPKPIMLVFIRDSDARDKSQKVIGPMISNCEAVRSKVHRMISRRSGNKTLLKEFDGGFLKIAAANSAANLRSDPIAVLMLDEVDGYPDDVDGEGSPIEIAARRLDAFGETGETVIFMGSTPAKPRGFSTAENEYLKSSMGEFHVCCPHCGEMQPLRWRDEEPGDNGKWVYRFRWEKDDKGDPVPGTIRYICAACNVGIDEKYKQEMLDKGLWVHRFPEREETLGFYIWAAYSPFQDVWFELAKEWTEAQHHPEKMKAFVNLRLAQTWDEGAENISEISLGKRREAYAAEVPREVAVLVATVDVQINRLEAQITGFGPGEEQFLVDHKILWGPPALLPGQKENEDQANVWTDLDEYLLRTWKHASGAILRPVITLVDSGAYPDSVYQFVIPRQNPRRRVYASRGEDFLSRPVLAEETTSKKHHVRLWLLATNAIKDRLMARLKIPRPGPGYIHLPEWTTDEYLGQLTAESKIPVKNRRTNVTRFYWVKNQERNEALDLTVYAHAALWILQNKVDPKTYKDLGNLHLEVLNGRSASAEGVLAPRVISSGI
jgi:phage terminase large subunit GpA-like protein